MNFPTGRFTQMPNMQSGGWNTRMPYDLSYPIYRGGGREEIAIRDLEYLQQLYPDQVKKYQRRVSQILDRTDYEGSMIYDEYPDKYSVRRMARSIFEIIQKENDDANQPDEEIIHILLVNEIYRRRRGGRKLEFDSLF